MHLRQAYKAKAQSDHNSHKKIIKVFLNQAKLSPKVPHQISIQTLMTHQQIY